MAIQIVRLLRLASLLRPTLQAAGIALLLTSLLACSREPLAPPPVKEDTAGLGVGLLNYSDIPVGNTYVNGEWAGGVRSHGGGGGTTPIAGIELPKRWRPGLTFELDWSDDVLYAKDPKAQYHRVVAVDPYKPIDFSQGFLWIAFFPNGVIKTVVSDYEPGWPGFPNDWEQPRNECRWGHNPGCENGKLKPEVQ